MPLKYGRCWKAKGRPSQLTVKKTSLMVPLTSNGLWPFGKRNLRV